LINLKLKNKIKKPKKGKSASTNFAKNHLIFLKESSWCIQVSIPYTFALFVYWITRKNSIVTIANRFMMMIFWTVKNGLVVIYVRDGY